MTGIRGYLGGGAFVLALGGLIWFAVFKPPTGTAKDAFVHGYTCPEDRVEIRQRKDIRGSQFSKHSPPADEIKNDPARYAIWAKEQAQRDADEDSGGNYGVYIFEARGCGHQVLYKCSNKPSCREEAYPEGVSQAW